MAILNPLNDLVAWVIMRLHSVLGALFGPDSGWAWGLSIVILVMLIRLCLVPLFVKQVNAQRKMAQHAAAAAWSCARSTRTTSSVSTKRR